MIAQQTFEKLRAKKKKQECVHIPMHLIEREAKPVDVAPLECLMCMEPMRKMDAKILPVCGHAFHFDCIDPVFRRELRKDMGSEGFVLRCPYCLTPAVTTVSEVVKQRKQKLLNDPMNDHSSPRNNKFLNSPRNRLSHNLTKYGPDVDYYTEVGDQILREPEKEKDNSKLMFSHGKRPNSPTKLVLQGLKAPERKKSTLASFGGIVRNESRILHGKRQAEESLRKRLIEEERQRKIEMELAEKRRQQAEEEEEIARKLREEEELYANHMDD